VIVILVSEESSISAKTAENGNSQMEAPMTMINEISLLHFIAFLILCAFTVVPFVFDIVRLTRESRCVKLNSSADIPVR